MKRIRLFPLRTVLFPGGPLQLRVFETRYLELVSYCLRQNCCFGVCLIREGSEAGSPAIPFPVGTMARIVDWETRQDGLLGVTAVGEGRFRLLASEVADNGLLMGDVTELPARDAPAPPQPDTIHALVDRILALHQLGYRHVPDQRDSTSWLSCRLSEILPLDLPTRQRLLEMDDPMDRLRALQPVLPELAL